MTDPERPPKPAGKVVASPGKMSAETKADAVVIEGEAAGVQVFSAERLKAEQRAEDARLNRELKREESEFRRHLDKVLFYLVAGVVAVFTVMSLVMIVFFDDNDVQQAGAALGTTILGGAIGAVAGYFAGKAT